jgi:2-polyprenyl-6-methoxyphenol hydroxylase-like FAD-dependent oxidoreductase
MVPSTNRESGNRIADVAIVGAGMAGAMLATVLSRRGVNVVLIDVRDRCAPTFKAERLEPDQSELMQRLGVLDAVAAISAQIDHVDTGYRGRYVERLPIKQFGASYHDMVNALRRDLPREVEQIVARVQSISTTADAQYVVLEGDRVVQARLVALASGAGGKLHDSLDVRRRMVNENDSTTIGFSIAPDNGSAFPFDALTYHPDRLDAGVDYLSLFACPSGMRANLFTYFAPTDPMIKSIAKEPRQGLNRFFPGLARLIGDFRITSKVEAKPIDLWVAEETGRDGLVLVADAFQTVSPSTGTGILKVTTDVLVLSELIPEWLASPGMSVTKTRAFYADARKRASDEVSLNNAIFRRRRITDGSLRMRIFRQRELARLQWQWFWRGKATAWP